ncbi:hypothetical protein [Mycolicibacterium sp. 624]|uniref:hypothetical protein n=1 Tax=Mycolicibacterium sp. 624 TaxID=3156314 RepID=UPI003395A440
MGLQVPDEPLHGEAGVGQSGLAAAQDSSVQVAAKDRHRLRSSENTPVLAVENDAAAMLAVKQKRADAMVANTDGRAALLPGA